MNRICYRTAVLLGVCVACAVASSGCAALPSLPVFLADQEVPPPAEIPAGQPTIKLQVTPHRGDMQRHRIPLSSGMLVEEVLVKAGLTRRFSNMEVSILRSLPDGKRINMDIHYDRAKNRVEPSYNYALLPDDLIMVDEIQHSPLDDLLDKIGDPLVDRYRRM